MVVHPNISQGTGNAASALPVTAIGYQHPVCGRELQLSKEQVILRLLAGNAGTCP